MYVNIEDPDQHIWYRGDREIFKFPVFRKGVRVRELYYNDEDLIQECINLFNSEITWTGMFNLQDAANRLEKQHRMFSLFENDTLLGYCWVDGDYLYNFFVSQKRIKGDSQDFCNYVCKLVDKVIRLYVVAPNTRGQKFFEGVGFMKIDSYI